jgi:uncharacterized membrane protein
MRFFEGLIEKDVVNTGRQSELDIGKVLPMLCLPFVHCIIECSTEEQLLHGVPYAFDMFIGGPISAPMFMFCMGAAIHFSKHNSPAQLAKRGLQLLLFGMILNICSYLLPFLAGFAFTGDSEYFLAPLPYLMFGMDILQFAGISLLIIALMLHIKLPKPAMLGVALALSVAGSFIRSIDVGCDVINVILGWFVGVESKTDSELYASYFPLFNWFIIPICGYLFGWFLQRVKNKKRFYLTFSPLLLAVSVTYLILGDHFKIGMFSLGENAFYHILTYDAAACIALTVGLLGVYSALCHILPGAVKRFITYSSRNLTAFYCIHWVLVQISTHVVLYALTKTTELALPYVLLISFGIVLLTFAVIFIYRKAESKIKKRRNMA